MTWDARTYTLLAADLLKACVDAYSLVPNAPDAPTTTFLTHGPVVADPTRDQISVAIGRAFPTDRFPAANLGPITGSIVGAVELDIELFRAGWPTPDVGPARASLVAPQRFAETAARLAEDASTVFVYVAALAARGALFPSVEGVAKGDIAVGTMNPIAPSGTVAGWRWPILVKLAIP